jgi:threonine dehydratase
VVHHGETLAEAATHACAYADEHHLVFIYPYDDDAIIAGQGTLALELLEDIPGRDTLAVPVGGSDLVAGCALAAEGMGQPIDITGVEVETMPPWRRRSPVQLGGATIAKSIAVRDVGRRPLEIIRRHVGQVVTLAEHAIENAIALLAEEAKVVAEGASAAGVAALLAHPELFRGRRVGVPICGANIDNRALAAVLQRMMIRDGRIMRVVLDIPDRPGMLGEIAGRIGEAGANIIKVSWPAFRERIHL